MRPAVTATAALAAVIVAALSLAPSAPASTFETDDGGLTVWHDQQLTSLVNRVQPNYPNLTGSNPWSNLTESNECFIGARVYVMENGTSGITRLRAKFSLRSPYDPGYLPTHQSSAWIDTYPFLDDSESYWFRPGWRFQRNDYGRYAYWVKAVGERPSFWSPDAVLKVKLGDAGCPKDQVDTGG